MAHRIPITIRLDHFEGPLDLLLYLIQSHELDVSRISISKITDQYLSYVMLMQELNFDFASEFSVMAATLLHWKSKTLLPSDEVATAGAEEEAVMSEEDLLRQLLEHKRFREMGGVLAGRNWLGIDVFTRQNPKPPIEKVWKTMDFNSLAVTYQDMLVRERKRKTILKKETVSISGKIVQFGERLKVGELTAFKKLVSENPSHAETVVTFLASLELGRLRKLRLFQEDTYQEIYLELVEQLGSLVQEFSSEFESRMDGAINQVEASL